MRADLKMGKGKLAVQAAHASVSSLQETRKLKPKWASDWFQKNQGKVCVRVESEQELRDLKQRIDSAGIPNSLIQDAGLTQLEEGTVTCLGIGPVPSAIVDNFTGDLRLL